TQNDLMKLVYATDFDSKNDLIKRWLGIGSINVFGRPFAGKDTQGQKLADLFNGTLLGGGQILRNSVIPEKAKALQSRGELIPSEDYVNIVLPYLSQASLKGRPLILSSVGRWVGEEMGVIQATKEAGHELKCVIYLELDEAQVRTRWSALEDHDDRGGRHDDTQEVLEKRLEEFREKTLPVIDAYEKSGLLIRIDGSESPETVLQSILDALASRASL
ncbi:MAG: nucleoside monophosphate kinase, partial [Candidatus Saccharibacteria bacterium]